MEAHDVLMLERALSLAEKGRGCTSPNPVVGAVIVRDARIIGEGYHVGPGRDHAEIAAMKDAIRRSGFEAPTDEPLDARAALDACKGTTIYVTLEPCCTYGRTPPCTGALLAAGFSRVVVGALDPAPGVDGKGISLLRDAGVIVEVAEGDLGRRMKRQNSGYRKMVTMGLPFVTYKYAMTADGRLATDTGDSRWISSAQSRSLVHHWRAWSDAVVVGAGTARMDDPRLTAREVGCARQPLRVVVGRPETLPTESALVRSVADGPVLVIGGMLSDEAAGAFREGAALPGGPPESLREASASLREAGVEVVSVPCGSYGDPQPRAVAELLAERGVQNVLLEGGRRLAGAWWEAGLVDKVACFVCPKVAPGMEHRGAFAAGGPELMGEALALSEVEIVRSGPDVLISGYTGDAY